MIAQTSPSSQDQLKQQWRDAVRIVSGRAADTLGVPFLTRLQKAQDLVLRDCVAPQSDGSYLVSGDSGRDYDVTADYECPCPDAAKAPELPESGIVACKHTLAIMLRKRSLQLLEARMQATMDGRPQAEAQAAAVVDLPEAPASANVHVEMHGRRVQLTLRDTDEDKLIARMDRLMARYPLQEAEQAPQGGKASANGQSRKVAELTDIACDVLGCGEFYWRNWDAEGKRSWLSHRAKDGSWHRYGGKR